MTIAAKAWFSDLLRKSVGLPEPGSSCCGVPAAGIAGTELPANDAPAGGNAPAADTRDASSRCGCGTAPGER